MVKYDGITDWSWIRCSSLSRSVLGGVQIPYDKGLLGHSDADVLLHAIMDALLGAAVLGDIGKLFPDTSDAYLDISSMLLLEKTMEQLHNAGYVVVNVDATVVAQKPKIASYIPDMRKNIAKKLQVSVEQINIKGTTEEKLGFTGDGSGISAHAVCLIEKVS